MVVTPIDPRVYKALLDHVSDGVYIVDLDRRILYWNEGAFRQTGYEAHEVVGRRCPEDGLCHVDTTGHRMCRDNCPMTTSLKDGGSHEVEIFLRHKQGRRVPVTARVEPLRAADGSIIGAIQIFSDDTAAQDSRREIEEMGRLAFLDLVTQLPNRRFVEMSLQTALSEYHMHKEPFGVLVIDLDRFKGINDSFGHASGDRALREVAKTLKGTLRPADIVGRWGGDEFIAIVHHVNNEILTHLAERCGAMVAQTSFPGSDGSMVSMSVSIGSTLALPDDTTEKLIKRADVLMYQKKTNGGAAKTGNVLRTFLFYWAKKVLKTNATLLLHLLGLCH
ncbi:MAG TPA: diguanylate cyclase [Verrucomicrobiae bacterium]|nr:diguanylate cyclase [Verrucomicrobiae bacterium]